MARSAITMYRFDGAVAGVASVALGAGLGELSAAILFPGASPFAAIGSALIDLAPSWAKDAAIALFGTSDKLALLIGIGIVLLAVAAAAGMLELRRPPWGRVIVLALAAAGAVAAMTRADAGLLSWVPSALAGIVAAMTLWFLLRRRVRVEPGRAPSVQTAAVDRAAVDNTRVRSAPVDPALRPAPSPDPATPEPDPGPAPKPVLDRRRFLVWSGGAVALGVLASIGGAALRAGTRTVETVRSAIRLPVPAITAPPIPAGAELGIPGLAPVITPNASFYRIDTALLVPQIDPATWSLRVHGLVEEEVTIGWDELIALPLEESVTTLACVSNEVGGTLIGNAVWLGYPIRELLARARPTADADMVLSRSIDGFTASTPLEALTDERDAVLAVGMNGEALPAEHGFPVRMVVPGLYGYVSATKWVTELEVTRFADASAYWTDRGWSPQGPIKLQSRIDVPRKEQGLRAGGTVIAGVAWQQGVGVSGVEVQIDEGPWRAATLATAISADTWVQWMLPWIATPGDHLLRCRAISTAGERQTRERADVVPDGASGWHERFVTVFE